MLPVLNFLQILKTHPQEGEILGQIITDLNYGSIKVMILAALGGSDRLW